MITVRANPTRLPFTFDERAHIYTLAEGVPVPSVTQIIRDCGLINFEHVAPDVLERKRQLGKLVHQACHFYDENDLPDSLPEEVAERLLSYVAFRKESGYTPECSEVRQVVTVQGMRYGMTFDSRGTLNGSPTIVDLKTGEFEPAWGIQIAAYELGSEKPLPHQNYQRIAVQLMGKSKYKVTQFTDKSDFDMWRACYAVAAWKRNHGK